jgi:hypothetical protein
VERRTIVWVVIVCVLVLGGALQELLPPSAKAKLNNGTKKVGVLIIIGLGMWAIVLLASELDTLYEHWVSR